MLNWHLKKKSNNKKNSVICKRGGKKVLKWEQFVQHNLTPGDYWEEDNFNTSCAEDCVFWIGIRSDHK